MQDKQGQERDESFWDAFKHKAGESVSPEDEPFASNLKEILKKDAEEDPLGTLRELRDYTVGQESEESGDSESVGFQPFKGAFNGVINHIKALEFQVQTTAQLGAAALWALGDQHDAAREILMLKLRVNELVHERRIKSLNDRLLGAQVGRTEYGVMQQEKNAWEVRANHAEAAAARAQKVCEGARKEAAKARETNAKLREEASLWEKPDKFSDSFSAVGEDLDKAKARLAELDKAREDAEAAAGELDKASPFHEDPADTDTD